MDTFDANKGRRVTDKQGVNFDTAALALRVEQMSGDQRILQAELTHTFKHLASSLDSLQIDTRRISDKVGEVGSLRVSRDQDQATMTRIELAVASLGDKVEARLTALQRDNEDRWLRHEAESEDASRETATNQRATEKAVESIERRMSRAVGWVSGIASVSMLILGGFLWTIDFRFASLTRDMKDLPTLSARLHSIELYLARKGADITPPEKEKE